MEENKTCLYDKHVALGALMQPFGGFIMPIQYSSIIDEHNAVRQHCGVFDVSHMGEVTVKGPDAERYVAHQQRHHRSTNRKNILLHDALSQWWHRGRPVSI